MKVAVYYNNNDVRIEEMPIPQISADEVLVKVIASGICGSDVMEWYRLKKAPVVLGHEITGEIVEAGKNVKNYKIGDRVFVSHHVPCNTCRYCLKGYHTVCETLHTTNFYPGGFAEYIRVPKFNVDRGIFLLPDEISFEEGTFIEPLGCVIRAHRIVNIQLDDTILILGSGISGLLHIALAHATGITKIIATDINEYRLAAAKRFGAEIVAHANEDLPKILRKVNNNCLADVVIVCTGAFSAFEQALKCVDRGGTVLFFAPTEPNISLPLPINEFWRTGIRLMPSYGAAPIDITMAIELIRTHRIPLHKMITHRLSLSQIQVGFQLVATAKESIKVIITPHN